MAYFLTMFLLFVSAMEGKDLGTHGHVFPIQEEDLLEYLKQKVKALSQGELEMLKKTLSKKYTSPVSVCGLKEAKEYRKFFVDPSLCTNEDIKDHLGNVIVRKGTCTNPLQEVVSLDALLFFDGSNPKHVAWAKSQNKLVKWVLTRGNPVDLEKEEEHPVYFDQFGMLVEKFEIQHLPAKVSQEGLQLKVEEFVVGS